MFYSDVNKLRYTPTKKTIRHKSKIAVLLSKASAANISRTTKAMPALRLTGGRERERDRSDQPVAHIEVYHVHFIQAQGRVQ